MLAEKQRLSVDSRKRITLTKLLGEDENVSSFEAYREGNRIVLIPMVEVPADEAWLFNNPKKLASVRRGLALGKTKKRGSFAKYANDEI